MDAGAASGTHTNLLQPDFPYCTSATSTRFSASASAAGDDDVCVIAETEHSNCPSCCTDVVAAAEDVCGAGEITPGNVEPTGAVGTEVAEAADRRSALGKVLIVPIPDDVGVAAVGVDIGPAGGVTAKPDVCGWDVVISTLERPSLTTAPSARNADGSRFRWTLSQEPTPAVTALGVAEGATATGIATLVAMLRPLSDPARLPTATIPSFVASDSKRVNNSVPWNAPPMSAVPDTATTSGVVLADC